MMKIVKCLLIGILIHSCVSKLQRCRNCTQRKTDLPVVKLRQLRYEYLKNQILTKLHLPEAPRTNLPKPSLKSLLVIAEMTENETPSERDNQSKMESVIIYPKKTTRICSAYKTYSCCRFDFVVPESLLLQSISAEMWFHKNRNKYFRVYQIVTDHLQNKTGSFELDKTVIDKNFTSITKYNVYSDIIQEKSTTEKTLTFEVVHYNKESYFCSRAVPFLVIRIEQDNEASRKKRSPTCLESSSSCCKENFFLSFSEIGWDNWILHPDGYQANFCRGRCFNDLSNTRFYHSAVLLSYIRDNKDLAEEIGLNMCCTPSVMSPVTIIYRNEEGLIYHKNIENMKVEACDCA